MKAIAFALLASLFASSSASSCGDSAIPFSFEALENGQPVLGCARPTCFGWTSDAQPISSNTQFYRVDGVADGFMRKSTEIPAKRYGEDTYNFQPQSAYCDGSFEKSTCGYDGQWVGGIGPVSNSTVQLVLQCCSYEGLRYSTDRGVATIQPGQTVIGGEVMKKGRQYAFDYISDIALRRDADGRMTYDVSVRRFPCVPVPIEPTARVDTEVHAEMVKKFDHNIPASNHIAFQAPIRQYGVGTLQQIGVQETIERIVETPVRAVEVQQGYRQPERQIQGPYQIVEEVQVAQPRPVYQPQPQQYYYQPAQQYYAPQAPAQAPSYYAPAAGAGGSGGGFWCFAADTLVRTAQGKDVRMDELKVDDWVLAKEANKLSYMPVKSWLHRLPTQEAEFQKIELEDGTTLKLTNLHYIYKTTCDDKPVRIEKIPNEAVRAEEVQAGDCVFQTKGKQNKEYLVKARVVSNTVVNGTGIYAPLTASGDIIVNGIHSSCHAVVHSNEMQSSFFGYMTYFKNFGKWIFGSDSDPNSIEKDIPLGTETFAQMVDLVLPKNLHTL